MHAPTAGSQGQLGMQQQWTPAAVMSQRVCAVGALSLCVNPALRVPLLQVIGCSVDSHFSHLAWVNTPRNKGGLGGCSYPLLSDLTKQVARDYEVLIEDGPDAGVALR